MMREEVTMGLMPSSIRVPANKVKNEDLSLYLENLPLLEAMMTLSQ